MPPCLKTHVGIKSEAGDYTAKTLNGDDLGKITAMVYIMTKNAVKSRHKNPLPNPNYYLVLDDGCNALGFE